MTEPVGADDAVRHRDADATRAALIAAAHRRFTLLGYARTTTRDLAADAGVNVALISRYFGSKDGLLAAVLAESGELLGRGLEGDPIEVFVDTLDGGARAAPDQTNPLLLLLRADGGDDTATAGLRRAALRTAVSHLEQPGDVGSSRLRADLTLALLAGIVTLRELLPDEPVSTVDSDELRAELHRVVALIRG